MAFGILSKLQSLWPFSIFNTDDLKVSACLVRKLSIPEETKQFVYAVHDSDSHVVYILAAQNLSEQSAQDAQHLIEEVQPDAVVVQVAPSVLAEIQAEERSSKYNQENNVPTSSCEVLRRCLIDKVNKDQYDNFARSQVLHDIFGVGFYGHFSSAIKAAAGVGSQLLALESPYENAGSSKLPDKTTSGNRSSALTMRSSFLPGKAVPSVYSGSWRFCLTDNLQSQMVKSLIPSLNSIISTERVSHPGSEPEERCNYQAPLFAQSVYPLLADLHNIFHDLPAIGKALISAQKMLDDVKKGEPIDTGLLSDVQNFRVAVEALRVALNNAARCPMDKKKNDNTPKVDYTELSSVEKCHALFAQTLRSQAKKYGTVVAIVDAASLSGLRKHWNTQVPVEVAELANRSLIHYFEDSLDVFDGPVLESLDRKRSLADKPVVAVGAGATAFLGGASLSKAVPASTLFKLATYKFPVSYQVVGAQMQRIVATALTKFLGPTKFIAPKVASVGAKTVTAEKIRVVTHGVIASVERTSLLAIRTSFYRIMRQRGAKSIRLGPCVSFGCSVVTFAGLVRYGDGIECAAEAIPSVPTIATLGRGLQSLHRASLEVKEASAKRIQEASKSLMINLMKKEAGVSPIKPSWILQVHAYDGAQE